ncbi:Na+/H+ antiporter subunit E [Xylophilus sp. ASV27]|uniref:Na+/H+ antiporter subunit E n=1 Tax=Xylophilus sp. ASV27 TaxID=2795129 RepID=UPI001E5173BA|nr:Na+/H+ antiporter subunit E [Xylophilus sp. ASV27]
MIRRLVPHPLLSAALFGLWLLLVQSLAPPSLLMALLAAIAGPLLTDSLRPAPVRMRRPWTACRLMARVLADALRSNLHVARLLLTRRSNDIPSAFVRVPLELRDPNALAVLALILCATPGTTWAELALDRSVLLLHVFDARDPGQVVADIKQRYERPLMEIFE